MNLRYVALRFARHLMPDSLAQAFKLHGWIIRAGMETTDPYAAAERYLQALAENGESVAGKRVLVLGYGGRFATGCALLRAGAAHVVLCEYEVKPDEVFNQTLLTEFGEYLKRDGEHVTPDRRYFTLLEGDIRHLSCESVDVVLSNSVFEHLGDVEGITSALSALTAAGGTHLHFIDMRDHYFKYPFEMLTFSEAVWKNFLNPSSNLNRWRLWQYRDVFEKYFTRVELKPTDSNSRAFESMRTRIRPEFLNGKSEEESVTQIQLRANKA